MQRLLLSLCLLSVAVPSFADYDTTVLSYSPVAYWKLQSDVTDLSGNGNTLTNNGSITFAAAGPWSGATAATFNGSSQYFSGPVSASGECTIIAWVRLTADGSFPMVATFGSGGTPPEMRFNGSSRAPECLPASANGVTTNDLDTWYMLAAVRDGTNTTLYRGVIGGGVTSLNAQPIGIYSGSLTSINIGRRSDGFYLTGQIARVSIHDTALSEADLEVIFADQAEGSSTSFTVGQAKVLNGSSGTVTVALSGTGTAWTGTPFTLTGTPPTGWSISSQNVVDGDTATVTLTKGTGEGTITIDDGDTDATVEATDTGTTVSSGNVTNTAIWDTLEQPGPTHSAVIADATGPVTINADWTIDGLFIGDDLGYADATIAMTTTGDVIQGNCGFDKLDGDLVFDDTAGDVKWLMGDADTASLYANCVFTSTGGTVSKLGSNDAWFDDFAENSGTGYGKIGFDCTDTTFEGIADPTDAWSIPNNDFGGKDFKFDGCTFDACAPVGVARPFGWGGGGTKQWYFRDCTFTNSIGNCITATIGNTPPAVAGDQQLLRCYFDEKVQINGVYNVTDDIFFRGWNPQGTGPITVTGSLFREGAGDGVVPMPTGADGCYWFGDETHPSNPHGFNAPGDDAIIENCIFECQEAGGFGEAIYQGGDGVIVRYNLVLPCADDSPYGALCNNAATGGPEVWVCEHNTVVGTKVLTSYPHVVVSESDPAGTPQFSSVKSNLCVDLSVTASALVVTDLGANTDNPVLGANATHNGMFNQASFADPLSGATLQGYRSNFTDAPGANDVIADPQFVDPTRNFAAWAVHKGYADSGDTLATKTAAAFTALQGDPTLLRTDAMPWIKAGFAPTNVAYEDAGHDGVTIGAVEFSGTPTPLASGTLTLDSKTDTTVTLSWTAASGGTPPYTYSIEQSPSGAETWTEVATDVTSPHQITGLSPNIAYDFRLKVTDSTPMMAITRRRRFALRRQRPARKKWGLAV